MDAKPPDETRADEHNEEKKGDTTERSETTAVNIEDIKSILKKEQKNVDLALSRNNLDDDIRVKPDTKIYIDLGNYSYSQPGQYPGGGGGGYWGQQAPPQAPPYQAPAYYAPQHQGYPTHGPHMWGSHGNDFEYEPQTRNIYVKKIFILTFFCLLVVAATAIAVRYFAVTHKFFRSVIGFGCFVLAMAILMVVNYAVMCYAYCQRSPCSWIALFFETLAMTYIVAFVTIKYNTPILMVAMAITAGIVLLCIGLACTSFDFTKFYLYFVLAGLAMGLVVLVFVALRFCGIYYKPLHIGITAVMTLIQIVGLVMHLQMILGGRSIEFDEDDIAIPTLILFTSIITIFLNILTLLNLTDAIS